MRQPLTFLRSLARAFIDHARIRPLIEFAGFHPRRSYALNDLDLKLATHLNFRNGYFIEAGANDGLSQSNTAFFERYLGWRGLLIEPIPSLAAKCRVNRPKATIEQCALVAADYNERVVDIRYCNLMSVVNGARGSAEADQAHIESGLQFLAPGEETYTVSVPARTLQEVMHQHGVSHVDLLSLDVEGYEAEVLRGVDFAVVTPRYILVEANDPDSIEAVLGRRYELIAVLSHHDRLYRLADEGMISPTSSSLSSVSLNHLPNLRCVGYGHS
jgi:FkbM family methyltransferase